MDDYFSIDAILATEPRVYSRFRVVGHSLGHLDPLIPVPSSTSSSDVPSSSSHPAKPSPSRTHDLPMGHRVALPFWLAESLVERSVADVELPRCFSVATRNELRADPVSVNLHRRCAPYFDLGVQMAKLVRARELPHTLQTAYGARCWRAVDAGVHGSAGVLDRLENKERRLFFAARAVAVAQMRWKERRSIRIKPACTALLGKRSLPEGAISPVTPRVQSRARVS